MDNIMRLNFMLLYSILFLLALTFFTGCSSTKLVESWSDPGQAKKPVKKILVLGVMHNDTQRRMYEDIFAKRISKDDVVGVAGYTIMPNREDYDNEDEIKAAVEKTGVDAALIARLVAIDKETTFVPPSVSYQPSFGYHRGLYDYYGSSYRSMYTPGYTTTDTIVRLETTVFSTETEQMIWAGSTKSFNPSSAKSLIQKNADLIVGDMKKAGLM
jgi:hypothetical protein